MASIGGRLRPTPQTLTISGTATGSSTDNIVYGQGYSNFGLIHVTSGSTKNMSFTLQGSIGETGVWTKLMAITTGSTAGAMMNSTAALIVDRVRITSTANLTTSTGHELSVTVVPLVGG